MALMDKTPRIVVLEGSRSQRERLDTAVSPVGLEVRIMAPEPSVLQQIRVAQPDYLFLDGDLPDGVPGQVLADLRMTPDLARIPVVWMTTAGLEDGRLRAHASGADEVLTKPCTLDQVLATVAAVGRFQLHFWGARGTLPLPGQQSLKYGGNTSCVSLDIGLDRHFVFDAGTGLRRYSQHLLDRQGGRFDGRIFISHPHWDHLNCLPFFAPFYVAGNRITLMGPPQGERSFRQLLDAQMDGVFFPITTATFAADLTVTDLSEGRFRYDGVAVSTYRLRHPGHCLAFRVEHGGHSMVYVTDNELGEFSFDDPYIEGLLAFLNGADVLIHDTTYFDDEYPRKANWGHSSVSQVVRLAGAANVHRLYLFHHDPEHGDVEIDRKLACAQEWVDRLGVPLECAIAVEGEGFDLASGLTIPAC